MEGFLDKVFAEADARASQRESQPDNPFEEVLQQDDPFEEVPQDLQPDLEPEPIRRSLVHEPKDVRKSEIPVGPYTQFEPPSGPVGTVVPGQPYGVPKISDVGSLRPTGLHGRPIGASRYPKRPSKRPKESDETPGEDGDSEVDVASFVRGLGDLAADKAERMKPPFWNPIDSTDYALKEDKFEPRLGLEKDMYTIKSFLQREERAPHKINLFDHLSAILDKLISEHPPDAGEIYEEISRMLRATRYIPATDHLQDIFIPPLYMHSETILRILKTVQHVVVTRELEESDDAKHANLIELIKYFDGVGISQPRLIMFCIRIALTNLARTHHLKSYRLWGFIMGIYNNYIVAETELFDSDIQLMQEEAEEEERKKEEAAEKRVEKLRDKIVESVLPRELLKELERYGEGEELGEADLYPPPPKPPPEFPPLPEPAVEKKIEIPSEKRGEGANRKVYFVTDRPDGQWVMLPDVTPKQIQVARKIRKFLTGDLDTEIHTYPRFPGKEINLLRAQIARISASTHVSPKGYFKHAGAGGEEALSEEESVMDEDEEGGGGGGNITENPSYKQKPIKELINVENWVHHAEALLDQGRTTFWSPDKEMGGEGGFDEEMSGEDEDREEGGGGKVKKEVPPPIFRSISKDTTTTLKNLWSVQASTNLLPEIAVVLVRSELWPGACAFASERKFENLYIGWALKNTPTNLSIPSMPVILREYPTGPEIMEITDPTWEQEEAWRLAHEPKPPPPRKEMMGEGEEDTEEGDEEEEDESEDD